MEGEGRGVGFAGFDGACEEIEGEELHFVCFVTEVGWNSALSSYVGLQWNAVVLADWFGVGRFATNNFWPRERVLPLPALWSQSGPRWQGVFPG